MRQRSLLYLWNRDTLSASRDLIGVVVLIFSCNEPAAGLCFVDADWRAGGFSSVRYAATGAGKSVGGNAIAVQTLSKQRHVVDAGHLLWLSKGPRECHWMPSCACLREPTVADLIEEHRRRFNGYNLPLAFTSKNTWSPVSQSFFSAR